MALTPFDFSLAAGITITALRCDPSPPGQQRLVLRLTRPAAPAPLTVPYHAPAGDTPSGAAVILYLSEVCIGIAQTRDPNGDEDEDGIADWQRMWLRTQPEGASAHAAEKAYKEAARLDGRIHAFLGDALYRALIVELSLDSAPTLW